MDEVPVRIEGYDISNLGPEHTVASMVVFAGGAARKSDYRRFRIRGIGASSDDFASMNEVLARRLARYMDESGKSPHDAELDASFAALPGLIVIDGGKGQLAAAMAAMKDVGVEGVDMVGLAKSRDLDSVNADVQQDRSPERVFLVGRKDPIVLPQTSPELFALTRLRDEAHRFAITFQRKLNRKRGLSSALDQVPGVGEARRTALLRHFGSLKRVREASIEEIAEVEGMGPAVAERLHAFLHAPKKTKTAVIEGEDDDAIRLASLDDVDGGS